MPRNLMMFLTILILLLSLESCAAHCDAGFAFNGTCPNGQINIDDGKESAAISCKTIKKVANKNELVAEIKAVTKGGDWTVNLNYIDISAVTDLSYLFAYKFQTLGNGYNLQLFNGRIDKWNTSNVTNMSSMFYFASDFNQPIGKWNTSKVKSMNLMFDAATSFNQPIGDWDVSNVTNMEAMFGGTAAFSQDLSKWNTAAVKNFSNLFIGSLILNNKKLPTYANWYCLNGNHDGGCQ